MKNRCLDCRFFNNEPGHVEQAFPGLTVLSSAYASVRADAGLCSRHEIFLSPWYRCRDYEPRPSPLMRIGL
ncbi:MAG: hypothetical protein WCF59_07350 [Desulfobaccales bacterium]